jgi:phosphohistidine phosphatase
VKLWILRHGEAEGHARTDAERNLTEHGRGEVLRSAAHLIGQPITAIVASPYVRAQQTAFVAQLAADLADRPHGVDAFLFFCGAIIDDLCIDLAGHGR